MSLGFALVHPARIDTALEANPMRLAFDDGVDTIMASLSVLDPADLASDYGRELQSLMRDVGTEASRLFTGDGPLGALMSDVEKLISGELGFGALLEKVCDGLTSLDRDRLRIRLTAFVDGALDASPLIASGALLDRLQSLALLAIDHFQRAFRSGRDDLQAHRGFRAGVFLRSLLEPLLEALNHLRGQLDLRDVLRRMITDLTAKLDDKLFAGLRVLKDLCTAHVHPIAASIQGLATAQVHVAVDVDTQADPARIDQDEFPAPHPPDDGPHWTFDLVGSIAGLFWHFWDYQRTSAPGYRFMEHVSTWLLAGWEVVRLITRAARPEWLQKSYRNGDTYWFSEWGDLWIQLVLRFLGTIHDMTDWSNWTMSMGTQLAKYYLLWVQCRAPYLFSRSVWYLDQWRQVPEGERPPIPLERYVWAGWVIPWVLSMILGLAQQWEDFQLQNPFGGAWMGVSLVLSAVFGAVLPHAFNSAFMRQWAPDAPMQQRTAESWVLWAAATFAVMWMVMMAFGSTNPGQEWIGSEWGAEVFYSVICAVLFFLAVLPALQGGGTETSTEWRGYIHFFHVSLGGALAAGAAPFFLWWIVRDDGRDPNGEFSSEGDLDQSPWNLPYPRGEAWFCGQGFHGIFSHTAISAMPGSADNHFAYDFNEAYDKKAIASRDGYAFAVNDTRTDGGYDQNEVRVVNLGWVEHFDPGTNEERILGRTTYMHLAQDKARLVPGQVFRRGQFVAQIDDTGVSALNHLHFQGSMRDRNNRETTYPVRFKDESLRRWRSWGSHPGRGFSFRYYESGNAEEEPLWHRVTIDTGEEEPRDRGGNVVGASHAHSVTIDASILAADGSIPDEVVVFTDVQEGHRHRVRLTKQQLRAALERDTAEVVTETSAGHTHPLLLPIHQRPPAAAPGATSPRVTSDDIDLSNSAVALGAPPTAQLVGRTELPVDLRGERMVLRIDGEATAFFDFGADRAAILGDVALDRAPSGPIRFNGSPAHTPTSVFVDEAAGEIGARVQPHRVVRLEPVLVIETRRRGTNATLSVSRSDLEKLGIELPSGATDLTSNGTGFAGDLAAVPRDEVVNHVRSIFLDPGTAAPPIVTSLSPLTISLGGSAVASFAGSSPRLEQVLPQAYDAGGMRREGSLPASDGRLLLTNGAGTAQAYLLGTPARVVAPQSDAWLDGAVVTDKFLEVELKGQTKRVTFDAADVGLDMVARRIMLQVSGVRAWAEGDSLVVETVAAGRDVTLRLSKNKPASAPAAAADFTSPLARGSAAPRHDGTDGFAESTSLTPAELAAVLDDAAPFGPASVPGATVTVDVTDDLLKVELSTGTMTHAAGGTVADVLHLPPPGPAASTLESTTAVAATLDFGFGGWLDFDLGGGNKRRVPFDGSPARLEIGPIRRWPADDDTFTVVVNGTSRTVTMAGGTRSIKALADEIQLTTDDVTVRIAYRYGFDNAAWGNRSLLLVETDGLLGAGLLRALPAQIDPVGRGLDDQNLVLADLLKATELLEGTLVNDSAAAFTAQIDGGQVKVSAPAGREVKIDALDSDPFRLVGGASPAFASELSTAAVDVPLGKGTQRYLVTTQLAGGASGDTIRSRFEISAAPATLRGEREPEVVALDHDLELIARVTAPRGSGPDEDTFEYRVAFRGVTSVDEVVTRLACQIPLVAVWLKDRTRLHIETVGSGTGWSLHLEGSALPHLGFDTNGASLTASGKGQIRNAERVSAEEIVAVVNAAAEHATRTTHEVLDFQLVGSTVVARSNDGAVTLTTRPASLRDQLGARDSGGTVVFDPGPSGNFALIDDGLLELRVGGSVVATAFIHGSAARLESSTDPSGQLPAGGSVTVTVNGAPHAVPMAGLTTLEDVIRALQSNVPDAWFGVVPDGGGNPVLRIEGHQRGSGTSLAITVPAAGDLGFATGTAGPASGSGVRPVLDNVAPADLLALLRAAGSDAASPQTLVTAQPVDVTGVAGLAAGPGLGVAATGATAGTVLAMPTGTVPGGLTFAVTSGRLEASVPAPLDVTPGVLTFEVQTGAVVHGQVSAPFWANPARAGGLRLPAALGDLDDKVLSLTIGSTPVDVTFTGIGTESDVISQIHTACAYRVRARIVGGVLELGTVQSGSGARLEVRTARFGSDALAVIDNPPLPLVGEGSGVAANLSETTVEEYARAITAGYAGPRTTRLQPDVITHARTYTVGGNVQKIRYRSDQIGCHSAVIPLAAPKSLRLDRSLQRGPAVRASVKLEATANPVALEGVLPIVVSRWPGSGPETQRVEVGFAPDSYEPERIAATIDAALSGAGLGRAAAYPDGAIVVEAAVPGLLGTLEIDSAGAPDAIRDGLSVAGTGKARGWPGAAMQPAAGQPYVHGYRSRTDIAGKQDGVVWTFSDDFSAPTPLTTPPLTLSASHTTMEALQQAVDQALGQARRNPADPPLRIGHARIGEDEALYIEGMPGRRLELRVEKDGAQTTPVEPEKAWLYHDRAPDPGMDLRPTHVVRTWRRVFDPVGKEVLAQLYDLGWTRVRTDANGEPINELSLRNGHYFVSVRPEAGRAGTDTYGDTTDLVISGGKASLVEGPGGPAEDVILLHQVRYGADLGTRPVLGVVRLSEPSSPADIVRGAEYVFHVFIA